MNNVDIVLRERGKIVARRSSHNIWCFGGKLLMGQLAADLTNNRLRYLGLGIGGFRQTEVAASTPPLSVDYPGTNYQTNMEDSVPRLERPVRFTTSPDVWLKQFTTVSLTTTYTMCFTVSISTSEITLGTYPTPPYYLAVPLSEVALFANGADVYSATNTVMAYDVFDPITKNQNQTMTIRWTLRI